MSPSPLGVVLNMAVEMVHRVGGDGVIRMEPPLAPPPHVSLLFIVKTLSVALMGIKYYCFGLCLFDKSAVHIPT